MARKFVIFKFESVDNEFKLSNIIVLVEFKFESWVLWPYIDNVEFVEKLFNFEYVVLIFNMNSLIVYLN